MTASITLSNGISIPQLGFGTFKVPPEDTEAVVSQALRVGYRHIDTAAAYENEAGVGAALRECDLGPGDVFITTKLRNGDQGYDSGLAAFDRSLSALGVDQVDLYLLHWPLPMKEGLALESWRAMEKIYREGRARAIGVCNFLPHHLDALLQHAEVAPTINQIECHPTFQQPETIAASERHGIAIQAHTPLGQGADLTHPVIVEIAQSHGVDAGQVIIAWHLAAGRIVLPRSSNPQRQETNLAAATLELSAEERAQIDALQADNRISRDPDIFDGSQYPQK